MKIIVLLLGLSIVMSSCANKDTTTGNPATAGFDFENSDPAAVELADSIMIAMGGRENWDKTRYVSWNHEGMRKWTWDKETRRVRIEVPETKAIYLIELGTMKGRLRVNGKEVTDPDSLKKDLELAKFLYFNDLNSLAIPFRLKEAGASLKYMGEDTLSATHYNVLQVSFDKTSDTPDMKYKVYVDVKEKLVRHLAYLRDTTLASAYLGRPWDNYQKYGDILLSADRSDQAGPRNVKMESSVPEKVFTEFE